VWKETTAEDDTKDLGVNTDRLFTFEVLKTNEQEESITANPGFKVGSNCSSKDGEAFNVYTR
jgi:hypothetical protein